MPSVEKMNPKEERQLEDMEVEEVDTDNDADDKQSLVPPSTLNPRKSFSSLFSSIQSTTPGTSVIPAKTSTSIGFRATLDRASRSDITNLHSDKSPVFEVSKSFGQFTFGQRRSIDRKESLLCVNHKPAEAAAAAAAAAAATFSQKENQNIKPEIERRAKRRLRPLMQEKKSKPMYICSFWQIIFLLLLPATIVLISTILNQQQGFCKPSLNFTNVTEILPKLVHGQTKGVANLIYLLETNELKFKIIALVGGTGVGKSHVANIIKNSSPQSYYAFEYFPPLYNKVRQVYSVLSTCQCNIIILENLGSEDISDAAFFSQALRKRASDLCVVILALFNTQLTHINLKRSLDLKGSIEKIENGFKKEGIEMKAVGFEPLEEESLMKCIMEAIQESRLELSDEDINHVRDSLLTANSGCKGAYSKVQLLGKVPN